MTFSNILSDIEQLSFEQQETLIEIIQKRLIAKRRDDIAFNAKISLEEYKKAKLVSESAEEIINRLQNSLIRDE